MLKVSLWASLCVSALVSLLLMNGFVNDNLGEDFIKYRVHDGAEIVSYDLSNILATSLAIFIPAFIVCFFSLLIVIPLFAVFVTAVQTLWNHPKNGR